jgi:soluble lytic murein transglycosylase
VAQLLFPVDFEATVRQEASASKIDPLLVFSLIKQESAYSEGAESRVGALGLMQLMPETAVLVAGKSGAPQPRPADLLKGETNIRLGVRYLGDLLNRYNGNLLHALAAYNAGPERVDVWVKQWNTVAAPEFVEMIPFEETRNYVKSIVRNYAFYARLLENRSVEFDALTRLTRT